MRSLLQGTTSPTVLNALPNCLLESAPLALNQSPVSHAQPITIEDGTTNHGSDTLNEALLGEPKKKTERIEGFELSKFPNTCQQISNAELNFSVIHFDAFSLKQMNFHTSKV